MQKYSYLTFNQRREIERMHNSGVRERQRSPNTLEEASPLFMRN